jgi:regulator of replication initiation timing
MLHETLREILNALQIIVVENRDEMRSLREDLAKAADENRRLSAENDELRYAPRAAPPDNRFR